MRKKTMVILSVALCALALSIVGVFVIPSLTGQSPGGALTEDKPTQPDELTTYFFDLASEGKYEELYTLLSEQSQAVMSKNTSNKADIQIASIILINTATKVFLRRRLAI